MRREGNRKWAFINRGAFYSLVWAFLQLGVHNSFLCVYLCETESISNGAGSAWQWQLFCVCFFTWGKRAEVANHRLWELKATKRNRVGPNQLFNYSLTSRRFFNVRSKKVGKFRTVQTERHLARNVHTADTWTKNEKQTKYSLPIDFATWRWTLQSRLGSFSSPVVNKTCFVIEENDQISNYINEWTGYAKTFRKRECHDDTTRYRYISFHHIFFVFVFSFQDVEHFLTCLSVWPTAETLTCAGAVR